MIRLVFRVLLYLFISFSFPVGRLFEIFSWNNSIIKTEIVVSKKTLETKKTCNLFQKVFFDILNQQTKSYKLLQQQIFILQIFEKDVKTIFVSQKQKRTDFSFQEIQKIMYPSFKVNIVEPINV